MGAYFVITHGNTAATRAFYFKELAENYIASALAESSLCGKGCFEVWYSDRPSTLNESNRVSIVD